MSSSNDASPTLASPAAELRVTRARALRGANVWYLTPALLVDVQLGALATLAREDVPALMTGLRAALPEVDDDAMTRALPDRTRSHGAEAWWGTLLVGTTIALQRRAGAPEAQGRVVLSAPADTRVSVAITFEEESFAAESVRQAARVLRDLLREDDPEIAETVAALTRRFRRSRPDESTRAIMAAARRRGIAVRRSLDTDVVQLGLGVTQRRVLGSATERTSRFASDAAADSSLLRAILTGVGIPVPVRDRARTVDDALETAEEMGYPVRLIVGGRATEAADEASLRHAWKAVRDEEDIVVEQVVAGTAIQVLVVNGRMAAATELGVAGTARARDWSHALHPEVRAVCELAAGAVGLDVAGVDIVTSDAGAPLRANGGVVTAVHASPDLALHARGDRTVRDALAEAIVDMLYPAGTPTTIPVVSITGTNGKTTTTRLIAHLFRQTGRTVGFTTTDGVYLREQLLMRGDLTGPFAANVILSHRDVEVAVLETARGGILKSGLGFEQCDAAVVMNVTADHLGLGGVDTVEHLADVKGVLPAVVRPGGHAVLNADDPLVLAMRDRTPGTAVLFSTRAPGESQVMDAHLAAGGLGGRIELLDGHEHLVLLHAERRIDLGAAADIPLTFGGLARFQMQNVLAASLAAYSQGVTAEQIRAGLQSFLPSTASTPGRLNMIETPRGRVLLDYAHNPAAIAGLFSFVRAMPAHRRMALLSAPGDRRDDDLREIGRLAEGLDLVIMKEHEVYRRGRAPGAIAAMMADGLRATGFPAERVLTFTEEHDAVAHVMSVMEPGDVVIIIADDTQAVAAQLAEMDRDRAG